MDTLKEREAKVRQWFEECDTRNPETRKSLLRAVKMIYDRQTRSEQQSSTTHLDNGVGFNKPDASFFTFVAQTFHTSMPNRHAIKCKFRLKKYARQIAEIALDNERRMR